jgi:hypothetical protein
MNATPAAPQSVRYQASDCVVEVTCKTAYEADAVRQFASQSGFSCPAPAEARPVYHCRAKTHDNGEVLWG